MGVIHLFVCVCVCVKQAERCQKIPPLFLTTSWTVQPCGFLYHLQLKTANETSKEDQNGWWWLKQLQMQERNVSCCRLTEQNTRSCEEVPAVPEIANWTKIRGIEIPALRCKKQHITAEPQWTQTSCINQPAQKYFQGKERKNWTSESEHITTGHTNWKDSAIAQSHTKHDQYLKYQQKGRKLSASSPMQIAKNQSFKTCKWFAEVRCDQAGFVYKTSQMKSEKPLHENT